jgi:hypothetical protein
VNANIYNDKCDVYLNGGPDSTTGKLEAGVYYFQVETPDGATNLSNFAIDTMAQREVHIDANGRIDQYLGTLHATGTDSVTGAVTVGLAPFADTTVDHEYKVELFLLQPDDTANNGDIGQSKTDNFKSPTETFNQVTNFGTISGRKFEDLNANGTDDSDPGVQGWKITLTGTGAGPDGVPGTADDVTVNTTTTTASDGSYSFGSLYAGTYTVTEESRSDWTHTTTNPVSVTLTSTTTFSCPDIITTVGNGTANFGNFHNISISGTKYQDLTGDGFSADDPVLNSANTHYVSVTVDLYKDGVKVATTSTDSSGNYSFTNLGPGKYTVSEEVPSGWTKTDVRGDAATGTITASSGTNSTGNDFDDLLNSTLTGTGGFTLGYWSNKNGQALLTQGDFDLLNTLNLANADGTTATFSGSLTNEKAQLKAFLLGATATNMANMLSAQLATLELNTNHNFVSSSAVIDVSAPALTNWANNGQGSSLLTNLNSGPDGTITSGGLISVATLESEAISILGSSGGNVVKSGNSLRSYEEALKIVMDGINNDLSIQMV